MLLSTASGRSGCAVAGFSLVELMMTLAVMVVMTVIAVPGMGGLLSDARLSTQTDLLVSTLNSARLEAVKQRKNMTVCPLANPNSDTSCSTNAADWSKGFGISDSSSIIQRVQAKNGATLTTTATSIVFAGTFGSAAATASFTLCAKGKSQRQVDVGLSGHVSKKTNSSTCS